MLMGCFSQFLGLGSSRSAFLFSSSFGGGDLLAVVVVVTGIM